MFKIVIKWDLWVKKLIMSFLFYINDKSKIDISLEKKIKISNKQT